MLLEDGGDGGLDAAVAGLEEHLLLQNVGPEIADILHFLLEVHEFEGSGRLQVADGFGQPEWRCAYMVWN